MTNIPDLLKAVSPFADAFGLLGDVIANPDKYRLSNVGERKETRKIGDYDIPRKGKTTYMDNDCFEYQTSEFKNLYRELDTAKPAAIVDVIEGVQLVQGTDSVELTFRRYLIEEK